MLRRYLENVAVSWALISWISSSFFPLEAERRYLHSLSIDNIVALHSKEKQELRLNLVSKKNYAELQAWPEARWAPTYSAFHMGVQDCDRTDDWLLTSDHWFKIKRSDWVRALLFYFISRQFSVISRQQYLL